MSYGRDQGRYRYERNPQTSAYSVYTDVWSRSKEGCLEGVEELRRQYHPAGYGTGAHGEPKKMPNGEWKVTVSRSSSCD